MRYRCPVRRTLTCIALALLVSSFSSALAAAETLPNREVERQGTGPNRFKWRAYATNRAELRSAWERFNMRGDLPRIGPREAPSSVSTAAVANIKTIQDIELPDSHGDRQRIGDLWRDQPVVLVWLRHYG